MLKPAKMTKRASDDLTAADVLVAIAQELQRTQVRLDVMMQTVTDHLPRDQAPPAALMRSLQDHDRIAQRLACLQAAAQTLAEQQQAGTQRLRAALGKAVHLEEVRAALMGGTPGSTQAEEAAIEVELF